MAKKKVAKKKVAKKKVAKKKVAKKKVAKKKVAKKKVAKKKTAKKVKIKTTKNNLSVQNFIAKISDPNLRSDCEQLLKLFHKITKKQPKMWGASIVGFGEYTYYRSNGDEGTFMATGFSPRKSGPTIYIMPGYSNYSATMKDLGKYKLGKSCLYLKKLEDIDISVLEKLVKQGLADLKKRAPTDY